MYSERLAYGLVLYSYAEPIAFRKSGRTLLVELEWKYSRTTDRHRKLILGFATEASFAVDPVTREEGRTLAGLNPTAAPSANLPRYF